MVVVGVQGDLGEEKRVVWFMWEDHDDVCGLGDPPDPAGMRLDLECLKRRTDSW